MRTKIIVVMSAATLLLSLVFTPASHAVLCAVGPVDPATTIPAWYQDCTGLALAPCFDSNGFCSITMVAQPGFTGSPPIVFPTNFPAEGFYFYATATSQPDGTLYVAALEFALSPAGPTVPPQTTFARIKIENRSAPAGTYAITHPYGANTITVTPADVGIRFIEDIGIAAGIFTGALTGRIGPFLRNAGGLVTAPDGNVYIGNSITPVAVTGTPVTSLTVAGPRSGTTNTFTLEGKVTGMSVRPTTITFSARPGVDSVPRTITVTNLSQIASLALNAIVPSGPDAVDFIVAANTCPATPNILEANTSCTFNVVFNGAAGIANRTANIVVSSPGGVVSPVTIALSGTIDAVAPTVAAHFPNTVTGPLNVTLTAVFSEPMNPDTINNTTFRLAGPNGPVAGTVIYDTVNKTATFTPSLNLTGDAAYTATITTGATDLAGNPLAAPFTWSFTATAPDTTPPTIISVSPANNATGMRTDAPIIVTFSEPMLVTSITSSVIQVTTGGVPVNGMVTLAGNVATFTPALPLAFGTAYTVVVTTGGLDMAGNPLAVGQVINFLTNFQPTPPRLVCPANGATGVARPVVLQWDPAIDQDGDALSYHLFICNNPSFIGTGNNCRQNVSVTLSAAGMNKITYASMGSLGSLIVLLGVLLGGGIKGKGRMLLVIAIVVMSGVFVYSCGGSGGGGASDVTVPSVPTGVTATAVSATNIDLTWTASTDNVGVSEYRVYSGGAFLKSVAAGTATSMTGLNPVTNYCYTVSARDAAGNESVQSDPACATTLSSAGGDITAPTVPVGVAATATSATQIDLAWTASTDSVGVTEYRIYTGGTLVKSVATGISTSVTGLSGSTNYCFTVSARDAAGNESAQSSPSCATTLCSGGGVAFSVDGLTSGLTYYWKVQADDGKGGLSDSETRSFSTQ